MNLLSPRALRGRALVLVATCGIAACTGVIGDGDAGDVPGPAGASAGAPSGAAGDAALLEGRITRLRRADILAAVEQALGTPRAVAPPLTEDAFSGFDTVTDALAADATFLASMQTFAEGVAATFAASPGAKLPCATPPVADEAGCVRQLTAGPVAQLYRRPLRAEEAASLAAVFTSTRAAEDFTTALATAVEAALLSPAFLFRTELGDPSPPLASARRLTPYELAAALAFTIWGEPPGPDLLAAAPSELATDAGVAARAEAMLADPRAVAHLRAFAAQLFDYDKLPATLAATPALAAAAPSMLAEPGAFFDAELWRGSRAYARMLTSTTAYVDASLAPFYGVPAPAGPGLVPTATDGALRAGMLTEPGYVAQHRLGHDGLPIFLGKHVLVKLLCAPPGSPPADATAVQSDPNLTPEARKFIRETRAPCSSCHTQIDGIGWAWRKLGDHGEPVPGDPELDARATLQRTDVDGPLDSPADLGRRLSRSPQAQDCFAGNFAAYVAGRAVALPSSRTPAEAALVGALVPQLDQASMRDLVSSFVRSRAFAYRDTSSFAAPEATP